MRSLGDDRFLFLFFLQTLGGNIKYEGCSYFNYLYSFVFPFHYLHLFFKNSISVLNLERQFEDLLSAAKEETNECKESVIRLPGFGVGTFHFNRNVFSLADENFNVYCIDLLGQGKSWPESYKRPSLPLTFVLPPRRYLG